MKNLERLKLLPVMLVVMLSVLAASAQQPQPPKTSVESSPRSDTGATEVRVTPSGVQDGTRKRVTLTEACNAAVDELNASRILIDALEMENSTLRSRLETEKRANEFLNELNETRRAEGEALKATVAAKNETIAAKDAAIAAQDRLIGSLKTKKRSVWSRIADIAIGAAIGAVIK
jgi:hypothetical protein